MRRQRGSADGRRPVRDPFDIEGPAVISFSGGRTSGYMLRRILDVGLRPDVHVMFANTGKERLETLDFVHEIETRWSVSIIWFEYLRRFLPKYKNPEREAAAQRARLVSGRDGLYEPANGRKEPGFIEVSYATASRVGEPFDNMIDLNGLPNRGSSHCTTEMKTRVMKKAMLARGYDYWDMVIGMRADEPDRVAKLSAPTKERWEHLMPLATAGVIESDVMAFWAKQPFDLQLEQHEGNCDLCWKKSLPKKARIARKHPELVDWWAASEARTGDVFVRNEPPYRSLVSLPVLVQDGDDGCRSYCTD